MNRDKEAFEKEFVKERQCVVTHEELDLSDPDCLVIAGRALDWKFLLPFYDRRKTMIQPDPNHPFIPSDKQRIQAVVDPMTNGPFVNPVDQKWAEREYTKYLNWKASGEVGPRPVLNRNDPLPPKSALARGYDETFLVSDEDAASMSFRKKAAFGALLCALNPVLLLNFGMYSAVKSPKTLAVYNFFVGNLGKLSMLSFHAARQGFRQKTVAGAVKGCLGVLAVAAVGALVYAAILCPLVTPVFALVSLVLSKILALGSATTGSALLAATATTATVFSAKTSKALERRVRGQNLTLEVAG